MTVVHGVSEYYNGLDIYIYRPDLFEYGTTLQIVPMSNQQVMNQITCFQNNGSVNGTTTIQSLFPDLTLFTNLSSLTYARGVLVDNWSYNVTEYNRTNYYNFYVNHITGEPVQYVMFGYDSLFVRIIVVTLAFSKLTERRARTTTSTCLTTCTSAPSLSIPLCLMSRLTFHAVHSRKLQVESTRGKFCFY